MGVLDIVVTLGTDALAGVALVFPVLMLMQMMSAGAMGGGISSAVARALGGGRRLAGAALGRRPVPRLPGAERGARRVRVDQRGDGRGRRLVRPDRPSRVQAWCIPHGLHGRWSPTNCPVRGTHAMPKTSAERGCHRLNHAVAKAQRALGHENINSTVAPPGIVEGEIDAAIPAS
jgi:hypothetical protein